ncbi:pteridine reductase [Paraperlucidibaca baekdonensis]|uniref:Pteridine reductase n=2 Tax=Paraperlucidibaca baekdonensis TaxID=748120 RepID=A0A3E0H9I5_9GAMM|nr:pteridine reductase [Paraperlucidibaca baekdonensis]
MASACSDSPIFYAIGRRLMTDTPVALITGAAKRVGAAIAEQLHGLGWRVLVHCHRSESDAQALCQRLNAARADSAHYLIADLADATAVETLAEQAQTHWGRLDALVNNASNFYPTAFGDARQSDWDSLFASNVRAPFFLSQALVPTLARSGAGAIVNIIDIHAEYPLQDHSIYCMAKAANAAMTRALAKELAPAIRVNGVSPGAIAWPEGSGEMSEAMQAEILRSVPMGRVGGVAAIAEAVVFLLTGTGYITGQIIAVDGGRSVWG